MLGLTLVAAPPAVASYRMYSENMGQLYNDCGNTNPCGIWNTPLADSAPVDRESAKLVSILDQWFPGPTGNKANFSASKMIRVFIATSSDPLVKVTLDPGAAYEQHLQQAFDQVPFPSYAQPSPDSDGRMAIFQPSSNCVWEFWRLYRATNGSGWHASWGGRDCHVLGDYGVYRNVKDSAGNILEENGWGAPATSLPLTAGVMMVDELAHGVISHAISFALDNRSTCAGIFSTPAQRTDGSATPILGANGEPTNCVPEGARFRLPPPCPPGVPSRMGVCFNLSALAGDPPIVRMMAAAAQKYGMIDNNSTSGGLVGVESGSTGDPPRLVLGADPYTSAIAGEANTPFFGTYLNQAALALFPWSWLQLVQMHVTSSADPTWYTEADPPGALWPH